MKIINNLDSTSLTNAIDSLFNPFDRRLEIVEQEELIGYNGVNYKEQDSTLTIEACVPGFSREEIQLSVEDKIINLEAVVDGNKKSSSSIQKSFKHRFEISEKYDVSKVSASLNNGILEIKLPKQNVSKPKKVKID
ncbi:MAG: Hsp20 family protein [Opitutales bacterium]|nr:Hsp20 family protein [Opitutales bacterium]